MGNLDFLSKLVKENLPEGKVDSAKFLKEVVETYKNTPPGILIPLLREHIDQAVTLSQIHRQVDHDTLRTIIDYQAHT